MKHPYDQLPDESRKAYKAFLTYLELDDDRSNARVASKLGKSKNLIDRWSSRHDWVARSRVYDQIKSEKRLEKNIRDRDAAMERQAQIARMILLKVWKAAVNLNADEIGNNGLARLFGEASRVERIALGVDDDQPRVASVSIQVSHRPPEADAGIEYRRGKP